MHLRWKVLLLAVAPLLLAISAIAGVVGYEARRLAVAEQAAVAPVLMAARQAELRNYVQLALAAVAPYSRGARSSHEAQQAALAMLAKLEFGPDGYFFVYDLQGHNLMHPRQPQLVGKNLWDLRDDQGVPTIQRLLAAAKAGGGFVEYLWERPSTRRVEGKLGYVTLLPEWGWMIGTGIYLDDIAEANRRIDKAASEAIRDTLKLMLAIALVATVLVAVGGLALNLSDQRVAASKLRALAREVVLSQEAERARVARELHDGVSQWLVSVKFQFESALVRLPAEAPGAQAVAASLERGLERLNAVLRDVRRISHGLRPALLDDLGLAAALEHTVQEFGHRTGIVTTLATDPDLPSLPEAVGTALFRIAQEALANVEQHAAAKNVDVRLERVGQDLRLSVADDGHGFDPAALANQPRAGIGLSNMRERIGTLGGRLNLQSGPDGTTVTVELPAAALHP